MAYLHAGMIDFLKLLVGSLVGLLRSHAVREAEVAVLRQQLLVLKRSAPARLQAAECRSADFRLAQSAVPVPARSHGHLPARDAGALASGGFRLYWRWKSRRRRVGRPAVRAEIRDLVRTMSRDNPLWDAPRIHGELLKLGIDIAQSSVAKYLPGVVVHPHRAGGDSCANTPPTSLPLICLSSRRLGSNFSTGWSSRVWSTDGSSGPI